MVRVKNIVSEKKKNEQNKFVVPKYTLESQVNVTYIQCNSHKKY